MKFFLSFLFGFFLGSFLVSAISEDKAVSQTIETPKEWISNIFDPRQSTLDSTTISILTIDLSTNTSKWKIGTDEFGIYAGRMINDVFILIRDDYVWNGTSDDRIYYTKKQYDVINKNLDSILANQKITARLKVLDGL